MKYYKLALIACGLSASVLAYAASDCQQKQQEIQLQIDYAQQHGNQHRVSGLKSALAEVQQNCQDSQLQAKHQRKVAEKQEKVDERQRELKEAEQQGDAKKIAKKRKKLHDAEYELQQAQQGDD